MGFPARGWLYGAGRQAGVMEGGTSVGKLEIPGESELLNLIRKRKPVTLRILL